MPLSPGARLGPYEVQAQIGAGGMGEVYKATDTRLHRIVAIKILPECVSGMQDVKARFDREAQTIASLNHPNICTLHDVGRLRPEGASAGRGEEVDFLVMEYVEGETLAARLARGPLPLPEALTAGLAIADALDKAHKQSVVHRDLKPANVILAKGGPKVLDFGLAKWTTGSDELLTAIPTRADVTAKGTMLGTLQYMAPEQIEGREADARTDVFAFGALLYEMVTGRTAFEGKSQATLISAIMSRDPKPMTLVAPASPPALEHVVERCLAKDPEERWQSMHSVIVQLRWIAYGGARPAAVEAESPAALRRRRVFVAIAALGGLAAAVMAAPAFFYLRGPAPGEPFGYRAPVRGFQSVAMAPDGSGFVFAAAPGAGATSLYYRATGALSAVPLGGTANADQPFFSPDGRDIAFVSGGMLRRMPATGGPVRTLGTAGDFQGGVWNRNGVILFGSSKGLFRISDQGGTPEQVTSVEPPATGHYWPEFLPDGTSYLFVAWSSEQPDRALMAGAIGSNERTKVAAIGSRIKYAGSGHLLYEGGGALFAQAFNTAARSLTGQPTQLVGAIRSQEDGGAFDVSDTGVLIYFAPGATGGRGRGNENPNGQFSWVRRTGGYVQPMGEPGPWGDIDLSPDGNLVAMTRVDDGTGDIWVIDWQRGPTGAATRLTLDPADDRNPVWSPDGKQVAFTTFRKGNADIYVKNANNVGAEQPLLATDQFETIEDWARDGSHIAYLSGNEAQPDIWVLPLTGDRKPFPVVTGPFNKDEPQFSRDVRWLAYTSFESGAPEVYIVSFPDLKQREKASVGGGFQPRWSPDGNTLYYRAAPGAVMSVAIRKAPALGVAAPVQLFTRNQQPGYTNAPHRHQWSVSPDGERFLLRATHQARVVGTEGIASAPPNFTPPGTAAAAAPAQAQNPPSGGLTILLNWPAAIRKAPQ